GESEFGVRSGGGPRERRGGREGSQWARSATAENLPSRDLPCPTRGDGPHEAGWTRLERDLAPVRRRVAPLRIGPRPPQLFDRRSLRAARLQRLLGSLLQAPADR